MITSILGAQVKYLSLYSRHAGLQAHLVHDINLMEPSYALISYIPGRGKAAFKVTGSISQEEKHRDNST